MLFVLKRIGFFIVDNWKIALPVIAILLLVIAIVFTRACERRSAKLNEAEIQAAEAAKIQKNDAELKRILTTADARNKIADLQNAGIDTNVAAGKAATVNAIADSKKRIDAMDHQQLADELERMK